jgi:nucleotide-binding universal stress UspA family protein
MSRILVALDSSCGSEEALEAAVKLAQQDGGSLTAVAVLERSGNPALDQITEDVHARAKNRIEEVLETAANYARSRGVRLTPILREGHPAEMILRCAEEEEATLLVLGANSKSNGDLALGGTADQVSSHCPCTVLIARRAVGLRTRRRLTGAMPCLQQPCSSTSAA